jgi:hypothetical protein
VISSSVDAVLSITKDQGCVLLHDKKLPVAQLYYPVVRPLFHQPVPSIMSPTIAASSWRMDQYFDENEDDFMMRIVHNSCNIPCQSAMDHQLDVWTVCCANHRFWLFHSFLYSFIPLITHHHSFLLGRPCNKQNKQHCRQPLDFLSFFAHHRSADGSVDMELYHLPMGAYALPKACEYCGVDDTADCCRDCRRPRLYFARKKTPFAVPPTIVAAVAEQPAATQLLLDQQQQHKPSSPSASETSPRSWVIRGLMWH